MSAALAPPAAAGAAVPTGLRAKKKLLVLIAAVLLVLVVAGAGGAYWLKSKAAREAAEAEAADDEGGNAAAGEHAAAKVDRKHAPIFLPLDPFIVNLADKESDRFAQIGITLEVETPAFAEEMKVYMPAIRNSILLLIASKSSRDLIDRDGKEKLATEILREAVRPMGIDVAAPETVSEPASAPVHVAATGGDDEADERPSARTKKKKKAKKAEHNPLQRVHFSSFIIQ